MFRGSKKCSRDTYPESYITEYALVYEDKASVVPQGAAGWRGQGGGGGGGGAGLELGVGESPTSLPCHLRLLVYLVIYDSG